MSVIMEVRKNDLRNMNLRKTKTNTHKHTSTHSEFLRECNHEAKSCVMGGPT
jgi:hypothetical protein